jgi:hypothetical protein
MSLSAGLLNAEPTDEQLVNPVHMDLDGLSSEVDTGG